MIVAAVMAVIASPLPLFGFLTLKYLAYRKPRPWLRRSVAGRWVFPVVAGVLLFVAGIYMQLAHMHRDWLTEPYLAWWHCWLLLLALDVILLVAWVKAAIKDRVEKISRVVQGVKIVAREVLGAPAAQYPDGADAPTPSEGDASETR
ncbi:MAG: hypothetical protein ACYSU0_13200 [Planctomycetota bacterium]